MLFVAVDVLVLMVSVVVSAVSIHRASSNRRNFYHVETECISLFQYLSGLDDHPPEGQLLGLKNMSGSCVLYLDYTPKHSFNYIFTAHTHKCIFFYIYFHAYTCHALHDWSAVRQQAKTVFVVIVQVVNLCVHQIQPRLVHSKFAVGG